MFEYFKNRHESKPTFITDLSLTFSEKRFPKKLAPPANKLLPRKTNSNYLKETLNYISAYLH